MLNLQLHVHYMLGISCCVYLACSAFVFCLFLRNDEDVRFVGYMVVITRKNIENFLCISESV